MPDILVKNASLLTLDDKRRCFDNGALVIEDGYIVAVGETGEIEKKHRAEKVINAKNMVVMPGLINGHSHYEQSFFKGLTRLFTGDTFKWIREFKIALTRHMRAEDYYLSNLLACTEMIRFGTTCGVNFVCEQDPTRLSRFGVDNAVRAIVDSGIRTTLVVGVADADGIEPPEFLLPAERGANIIVNISA